MFVGNVPLQTGLHGRADPNKQTNKQAYNLRIGLLRPLRSLPEDMY